MATREEEKNSLIEELYLEDYEKKDGYFIDEKGSRWYIAPTEDKEKKVFVQGEKENISIELDYILGKYTDRDHKYSLPRLQNARNNLEDRNVLSDKEFIRDIVALFERSDIDSQENSRAIIFKGEEDLFRTIEELEDRYVTSRQLEDITSLSTMQVANIMGRWKKEYGLDEDELEINKSRCTGWNIKYILEEASEEIEEDIEEMLED